MKQDIIQKARGTRDFGPQEKIVRNQIVDTLRKVFELYGYNPIETPTLERLDLFACKYGIGEASDAMKETFKLKDQGDRDLVLRTEFTVPFARFIGSNKQMKMPFKRYQIGQVFRDGPIKFGRYREFWQCDVDAVGIKNNLIDAELINLINKVFDELNLDVEIKLNNRKVLNGILNKIGIAEKDQEKAIIIIDKLDKIGWQGVTKDLKEAKFSDEQIDNIISNINISGTNEEILEKITKFLGDDNQGIIEIKQTLEKLPNCLNLKIVPALARGLAYYTGNVFEVFLQNSDFSSAICGGGRYDNMIAGILGQKEEIPAIGISFGLDTIYDVYTKINKTEVQTLTKVLLVPMGEFAEKKVIEYADILRNNDINTDIAFNNKKLSKVFEYANSYGIPFVVVVGEDEIKKGKFSMKDMTSGKQKMYSLAKLIKQLKQA